MDSSTHHTTPGGWSWPDEVRNRHPGSSSETSPSAGTANAEHSTSSASPGAGSAGQDSTRRQRTHWPPRTCRICLETVLPTFNAAENDHLPQMFQAAPNVTYESEEGRLIRPCKCKGTQRYVHEGCLQAWRHADPSYGRRNYWQCPTCGFKYRLDRMSWGRMISSTGKLSTFFLPNEKILWHLHVLTTFLAIELLLAIFLMLSPFAATQLALTFSILFFTVFLLGFIGDLILDFYFDPWGTLSGYRPDFSMYDDGPSTWTDHFLKGGASLGLLSVVKFFFSPYRLFFRWGGGGGGRPGHGGRDRMADVSMVLVVIGVATFLYVSISIAPRVVTSANTLEVCLESNADH
jgi:hypothetical protein